MVINSPCLTDKKELAIPEQMTTGKELSNLLMAGSLPKTTLPTNLLKVNAARLKLTTAKDKTVNDEVRIQALVDGKRVNIKESSIRRTLKPKRKHTQESEVSLTESLAKQNLPSPSNDPLPSGEDSLKLKELMDLCTNLSKKVLELESEVIDIKSTNQERIKKLEGRVERLEEGNKVLKELKSVYSTDNADEPVMEKEKSSKQGRKIADIDADVEINLEKLKLRHIIWIWIIKKRFLA
nr:hypothetical protein [Tanacetum cinerariifolium]